MPTLADLRVALAANLETIPGCQVSPYMLGSPTLPCLYVVPGDPGTTYDSTMVRGLDEWTLSIVALTGSANDQGAQMLMDEFLAPTGISSVKAAAESDRTLGGIAADLQVTQASGYRYLIREGGSTTLWVQWTVEVIASGVT
jgi:hypothetical protein